MTDDCYVPDCRAHKEDKGKIITLIGGHYHRHKIRINNYARHMRMPIPSKHMPLMNLKDAQPDYYHIESQVETYSRVECIYGIELMFPEDMYLYDKIDPIEFLKTLVLDYLR